MAVADSQMLRRISGAYFSLRPPSDHLAGTPIIHKPPNIARSLLRFLLGLKKERPRPSPLITTHHPKS